MASLVPRAFSLAPLYAQSLGKSAESLSVTSRFTVKSRIYRAARTPRGPFLESPDDYGPGKLSPFTLKIEVSIVLHPTR